MIGPGYEIEILHKLADRVLYYRQELVRASDVCGDLDSTMALGTGAKRYGWVAPTVTDMSNIIDIQSGRHPLQELAVSHYIPNDCYLGGCPSPDGEVDGEVEELGERSEQHTNVLVLTGPNHSGKSIYLRQVALIVYLAHIGSFVPAQRATIGLTDRILTRMTTKESVCRGESAFSIDLRQMAFAIGSVTRRSLLLVDEFGKGTQTEDGVALMAALIENLALRRNESPRVLAATHHHELFEPGVLNMGRNMALAHMDARVNVESEGSGNELTFLYALVPGRVTTSFGVRCAAINGVDTKVVHRAEEIAALLASQKDLQSACTDLSDEEASGLERAEVVSRRFLTVELEGNRSPDGTARDGRRHIKELIDLCISVGADG